MKERTTANIIIKRGSATVITVPITEQCMRVFSLMTDDYITLEFSTRTAVNIAIGDYVDDEIFGRFVVTHDQMPQYDQATGSFKYSIQLDAEYMSWKNRVFMMTLDNNGVRVRKEANWRITSDLETQAKEIIKNVEISGFRGYSYQIENSAKIANEVKLMQYNGTGIIDALNNIAETWECEWWVSNKVLHFGKCEGSDTPIQFEIGNNVENMTINNNRKTYSNKVYVYGSTKNLPATYRKDLVLLTTNQATKQGIKLWYIDKKITPLMFPPVMPYYIPIETSTIETSEQTGMTSVTNYRTTSVMIDYPSAYSISSLPINLGTFYLIPAQGNTEVEPGTQITYTRKVEIILIVGNEEQIICENSYTGTSTMSAGSIKGFPLQNIEIPSVYIDSKQIQVGYAKIYVRHTVTNSQYSIEEIYIPPTSIDDVKYLTIEALGTSVIKVYQKGVVHSSETKTWTEGQHYKTGSTQPTISLGSSSSTYKMSSSTIIQSSNTYSVNLTVEQGVAAVVFFDSNNNVVGWIDGRGDAADYSWNETEHVDASYFKMTTSDNSPGQLAISSSSTIWSAYARINAIGAALGEDDSYALTFCNQTGEVSDSSIPTGMKVGDRIYVADDSITVRVPSAFFSTEFDNPSALQAIGETRLQMPLDTKGYLMIDGATERNAVEEIAIFDNIYPRCDLVVESIEEYKRTEKIEYEGEDHTSNWQWIEYTIKLTKVNGDPFDFSEEYMLPGSNLQIKFLTSHEMQSVEGFTEPENGCKLAGMTFEVEYRKSGEYIIGRNEEYGAKLPNDVLKPTVGDPCILLGWNPRAIGGLGLILDAEQKLKTKAQEYKEAIEEGQFTFDCTMMSDFMFAQMPNLGLIEAEDKRVKDSEDSYIFVKNGYNVYLIPTEGTKVTVKHGALKRDKQSRIIGYNLKLDKPYDSPSYTVGETQAYSKLAKIEKELSKVSS